MNVASEDQLSVLSQNTPLEPSFTRIMVPRFGLVSQDKTEESGTGKNKKIDVVAASGTFYIERETDELVTKEDGAQSKKWQKEYLDENNQEAIILYYRKQLRYYDEKEEKYTSSPIFDNDDEQVVLFKDRKEVARGTVAELKALYPGVDTRGRRVSKLQDEKIMYILRDGEIYQLNLSRSNLWAFQKYASKVRVSTVVTIFGSEAKTKGTIEWSQLTYTAKRVLTSEEATMAIEKISEIKEAISSEKEFYAGNSTQSSQADKDFDEKF